jgi:hypothetical protein
LRRDIFAFATRTPSALVGFCFGGAFTFPAVGITGRTGVDIIEVRAVGCVLIVPVVGLSLGIADNSLRSHSFETPGMQDLPIWTRPTPAPSGSLGNTAP